MHWNLVKHENLTQVGPSLSSGTLIVLELHEQVVEEVDAHVAHEEVEEGFGGSHVSTRRLHATVDAQQDVDHTQEEEENQQWSGLFAFAFSSDGPQAFIEEMVVDFEECYLVKFSQFFQFSL